MRSFFTTIFVFSLFALHAQKSDKRISRAEYIEMYKDVAIREMERSKIPASITLAQGILESGDGNSALARKANNHFGIKCHSSWSGPTYIQDDDEKDECFRKYKSALKSFEDHSDFLKRKRYAFLFDLKITDYKGWAKGLKKAGYATNPKYPDLLIKIIEQNNLNQYDQASAKKSNKVKNKKNKKEKSKKQPTVSKRRGSHQVLTHPNNIKFIKVKTGDNLQKIADEFQMGLWQLERYNDIKAGDVLVEGSTLFLQPKRGKAKEEFHTVEAGETLESISQLYGIKLSKLKRKNRLQEGDSIQLGDKLYLRKTKPK